MSLSKVLQNKYEKQLRREKERLSSEIRKNEVPEDFGSDIDAGDEEKNEAEALANQLALNQTLRVRVNEIDAALNRIREGTFGVCKSCGKDISEEVLNVTPESLICEHCKKK